MTARPVIGAQLSVLDLDRHRDWLFEKDRDIELPEFCMADILANPGPFIDMALDKLKGWKGRLGIHGPFSGFELDVKDREIRAVVQARLDRALEVCGRLGARLALAAARRACAASRRARRNIRRGSTGRAACPARRRNAPG